MSRSPESRGWISDRLEAIRSQLLPLAAALLLALPFAAVGPVQYFCHSMGRIMDACCCTAAAAAESVGGPACGSEIKARDCCERLERGASVASAASRQNASSIADGAALIERPPRVVCAAEPEAAEVVIAPIESYAVPPRGPPLFLAHCAFLI